ncbi:MAG: Uma2 family endonuclease [Xenococcaceae cyanobacterium MO_188.B32]|nr:Uma2 family endonuclease [Xenococcaceae cyanobacterium MO_188.B32]
MNVPTLQTRANSFFDSLDALTHNLSREDQIYIATDISWEQYEQITKDLPERSGYRISYAKGTLTIMSPGRNHEKIKEHISGLLEAYLQEVEIDYYPLGSTTLKVEKKRVGKEPDSCYCIETEKEFPDLAIEVVFSSGGIDSLEIYKNLQIREVWFWQQNELKIYSLDSNKYIELKSSKVLPDLDIKLLTKYIAQPNIRLAIKEFRQKLQK